MAEPEVITTIEQLEPTAFMKRLKKQQKENFDKMRKDIQSMREDVKKDIKKTINSHVRRNDKELKQLQQAFLNKEEDPMELWYLFKVAESVVNTVNLSEEVSLSLNQIFQHIDMDTIDDIYLDLVHREKRLKFHVNSGNLRKKLRKAMRENNPDGERMIRLFVRAIFDDTEVARESIKQLEPETDELMDEILEDI